MLDRGTKIYLARKWKGMTQEELAQKLGYKSKSSINKIELGKSDLSPEKVVECAEILEVSPMYLLGYTDDPNYGAEEKAYKEKEETLITNFRKLNEDGQTQALLQIENLTQIPMYKKGETDAQEEKEV